MPSMANRFRVTLMGGRQGSAVGKPRAGMSCQGRRCLFVLGASLVLVIGLPAGAGEPGAVEPAAGGHADVPTSPSLSSQIAPAGSADTATQPSPAEGYRLLTERAYLPPDFDQETIDRVWEVWPEPFRGEAERATPDERRRLIFARYGLTERPGDPLHRPLQYVVDESGNWTMNCLACHGGAVAGEVFPGAPNASYALELLTEETRRLKSLLGKPAGRMDLGSFFMPLGRTRGTTNAVMFGVALMAFRDPELNVISPPHAPAMVHHDMDAPPWWNFHRKRNLYIDGFAPKGVRGLMQFMMVRENGPDKFRAWESDFRHVYAYLESLRPPRYPFPVDEALAAEGAGVFSDHCARCHGTYGADGLTGEYPELMVPIDEVGTDRVRWEALKASDRQLYARSWFAYFGEHQVLLEPEGYVAPPLNGLWASAPYFHNGSVPTLWHLLRPDQRPQVWRRQGEPGRAYDQLRVGLAVEELAEVPDTLQAARELREYFNTARPGKGNSGHDFPAALTEAEKTALLEYLKTL